MKNDEILDRHIKDLEEDFGTVFGLRAFPGESFRINRGSSYVSEYRGEQGHDLRLPMGSAARHLAGVQ